MKKRGKCGILGRARRIPRGFLKDSEEIPGDFPAPKSLYVCILVGSPKRKRLFQNALLYLIRPKRQNAKRRINSLL